MMDNTMPDTTSTSQPAREAALLTIAVLAALASIGTLSTNILLPSLPSMAASLEMSTASTTSTITVFLAVFALGQLVVGPLSDRYGRRGPIVAGLAIFVAGSMWCVMATDLTHLLMGRAVQALGACAASVLSRAVARDLFSGQPLARALSLIMVVMAAAPGFSPLLGGAMEILFGWRGGFVFVIMFAAGTGLIYVMRFSETHAARAAAVAPMAIVRAYLTLTKDMRFLVPATTVGLVMGGLFAMFSAMPQIMIEGFRFSPIGLGLFFAGTVMVVFVAGVSAPRLSARIGLTRATQIGSVVAFVGSLTLLIAALTLHSFPSCLIAICTFLLGMGMVNPLASAESLSPFGENAGLASALLGFFQMAGAALGAFLTATISHDAMLSLGIVLTAATALAFAIHSTGRRQTVERPAKA